MRFRNVLALVFTLFVTGIQLIGCGSSEPAIAITGTLPSSGTVGTAYSGSLTASGGSKSYTWNVTGLPAGVTASGTSTSTLSVSGTPTTAGANNVSVTLTDTHSHTAMYTVTITIASATNPVTITGTLPATGTVGTAYSGSLTASGGTSPYTWTVTGLPAGVMASNTSSATVTVSGTPTAAGTSNVTVTLTDSKGGTQSYTVSIVISSSSTISIGDTFPNTGIVGTTYSGDYIAYGGTPPYTWTVTGLPTGVVPTNGTTSPKYSASGIPTAAGQYQFVATVKDSASNSVTVKERITISSTGGATFTVSPTTLGTLTNGTAVTPIMITSTPSGTQPYLWTVSSGALPAGLVLSNGTTTSATSINSTTNSINITGTPTAAGAYSFTLSVQDSASPMGTGSQAFSGTVSGGSTVTACATPTTGPVPTRGNESALKNLSLAFIMNGADSNDEPIFWAGSFTADGTGSITAADLDFNGVTDGPSHFQIQTANSSYSFGADGRGCLYLAFNSVLGAAKPASAHIPNPGIAHGNATKHLKLRPETEPANVGTVTFSFSFSSGYEFGSIEQFDYINSQQIASGQMHQQNAADFKISSLTTNFAFGASGWLINDSSGDVTRSAVAGSFTNTAGTLGSGTADVNVGGTGGIAGPLSGGNGTLTTTPPSSTTGRGTGSYTIPNGASTVSFDFAYYIINADDIYFVTNDANTAGNVLLTGRALKALATSMDLNGYYMPAISGLDLTGPNPAGNNVVAIGTVHATAETIPTATIYTNDGGTFTTNTYTNGTYSFDSSTGRVAFGTLSEFPPVGYLTDPAVAASDSVSAFLVGTDDAVSYGFLALQSSSAPNFGTTSLSGQYTFGSTEDISGVGGTEVGSFNFPTAGNYTATLDVVNVGETSSFPNQTAAGMINVNPDGSGFFDTNAEALVTNGPLILAIDDVNGSTQPFVYVFVSNSVVP